jgi:methyl-accepting chemotaxis protein
MRLKDFSINSKLLLSFGVVLTLLISLAAVSWFRFGSTLNDIDNSHFATELNKEILMREIDHHTFMATASSFFIDPNVHTMAVQTDHRSCNLGKWLYGPERKEAEQRLPQLSPLFRALEQPHVNLHQSIIQINELAKNKNKSEILAKAQDIFDTSSRQALKETQQRLRDISAAIDTYSESAGNLLHNSAYSGKRTVLILASLSLAIGIFFSLLISRAITGTTRQLAAVTENLAKGNMQARSTLDQKDEMGQLACSANILASSLNNMCTRVNGSSSTINASSDSLDRLSTSLFASAEQMAGNCNTVAVAAEEMNANMEAVAAATEQTSTNVAMVAAAAEEMTATITEIAQSSENARVITDQAVKEASKASASVLELGEAADKINKVTETINEIADQTNLLALNATIEAARAGEAGKGFAVVANEIKDLARQTTEATREIQERIEGVQQSSEQTIAVIGTIADIINSTSEIVSAMAAAVEEQAVTSQEIANNVSQASIGMQEVTENISQASVVNGEVTRDIARVKKEAESVAAGSSDVKELAAEMKANAEALSHLLHNFSFKQPLFDIGRIKDAHFNWKMKLTSVLNGYSTIDSKNIPDHHQCEFGKWYDNAPKELSSLPVFKEIGGYHEAVHRRVLEAVELYHANNQAGAHRKVEEFEVVRKQLFNALDQLYLS